MLIPVNTLSANQTRGLTKTEWTKITKDAKDAKAAKTLIWPTLDIRTVIVDVPIKYPIKIEEVFCLSIWLFYMAQWV